MIGVLGPGPGHGALRFYLAVALTTGVPASEDVFTPFQEASPREGG